MNRYINLNRLEFVITDACSGKCKHCSIGELPGSNCVDANAAVTVVRRLAERYAVDSVMTFGGEPLLFADTVCKIHATASDCGIPKRQLITNGFFTKDKHRIDEAAKALCTSVNISTRREKSICPYHVARSLILKGSTKSAV